MSKVRFEIGHIINSVQTEGIFKSDLLSDCIKEWEEKGYNDKDYFIDVWEFNSDNIPYPVADVKIEDWIFKRKNID